MRPRNPHVGFTLIELLIVIGVIAVLAIVVVLVLNPVELLRQSRDSQRLSDLSTLNTAVGLYNEDQGGSLGVASTLYPSAIDPSATSSAGDQCQGIFPAGFISDCAGSSWYKNVDNTGWIPINFAKITSGSPFGGLPTDPINQTSSNLFYSYTTNGTQYELTAIMESQKQKSAIIAAPPVPTYPGVYAVGTSLSISSLYNTTGLAGYWNFEEASGTNVVDQSGNGSPGTWAGTLGSQYGGGKVGSYAGVFNGVDNTVNITPGTALQGATASGSVSAWVNYSITTSSPKAIFDFGGTGSNGCVLWSSNGTNNRPAAQYGNGAGNSIIFYTSSSIAVGGWHLVAMTWGPAGGTLYVDSVLVASTTTIPSIVAGATMHIGWQGVTRYMPGSIDDVRVYSRTLSATEIQALYNAQR